MKLRTTYWIEESYCIANALVYDVLFIPFQGKLILVYVMYIHPGP